MFFLHLLLILFKLLIEINISIAISHVLSFDIFCLLFLLAVRLLDGLLLLKLYFEPVHFLN